MALKRDFEKEYVKSHCLPKFQEARESSSLAGGFKPVLQRILARQEHFLVSLACFLYLQQLTPQFSCISAGLVCLSLLVYRFPMWSTALCRDFGCFRSVITGVFDFSLDCAKCEAAEAACSSSGDHRYAGSCSTFHLSSMQGYTKFVCHRLASRLLVWSVVLVTGPSGYPQ